MARPQVADGGDGFHIWKVSANLLDKQLQTPDKRWSCSLEAGRGLITSRRKKAAHFEMLHRSSDLEGSCENNGGPSSHVKGEEVHY